MFLYVGCPDSLCLVVEWNKKSIQVDFGSDMKKNGTTKKLRKCTIDGSNTWPIPFPEVGRINIFFQLKKRVFLEKLLIYNVKEGWEPLCKFLEVPVPKDPMPRSNDKGQFVEKINVRNRTQLTRCLLWYGGLVASGFYIWKNGRSIFRSVKVFK